jgi:hypothetical protein
LSDNANLTCDRRRDRAGDTAYGKTYQHHTILLHLLSASAPPRYKLVLTDFTDVFLAVTHSVTIGESITFEPGQNKKGQKKKKKKKIEKKKKQKTIEGR